MVSQTRKARLSFILSLSLPLGHAQINIYHLNQKMSVLSQKLQDASKLFLSHNFKKSLEAYEDCIQFCYKTEEEQSTIFNITSTKATLQYILGDYDTALSTLNSVLAKDSTHFLCLLRRSQVYKKKNKLKKALKDLESIFVFCPDNSQISALKVEIEHMILKDAKGQDLDSQSSDEQQQDEAAALNFIKLKLIDRKSSDISAVKQRKSRVTILGDSTFEYKRQEDASKDTRDEDQQQLSEKALRTFREIDLDDGLEQIPIIRITGPAKSKKSILKNKGTSIFIQPEDNQSKKQKYLGRKSKLLTLVKNIDGKVIPSAETDHHSNPSLKQVEFRKSVSAVTKEIFHQLGEQLSKSALSDKKSSRKSCLKRPSFEIPTTIKAAKGRGSRFEMIDSSKIDGPYIHHQKRKSIDEKPEEGENVVKENSDSDNEGSQHNIFGSKKIVIDKEICKHLGITESEEEEDNAMTKSLNLQKKKSILKPNSSVMFNSGRLLRSSMGASQELPTSDGMNLSKKKSVMFNCTL